MDFSVVVPAHNEERLLPDALRAIAVAAGEVDGDVEVIGVANRGTDATVELARAAGAIVVEDGSRNIAAVRNAGAAAASGDILVTVDADCVMSRRAGSSTGSVTGTCSPWRCRLARSARWRRATLRGSIGTSSTSTSNSRSRR